MLGVGETRMERIRAVVNEFEGDLAAAFDRPESHGNKGRTPHNKTNDEITAALIKIFNRYAY